MASQVWKTATAQHTVPLLLLGFLLLIIAASRITRLDGLELNADEVWTVWQTFGTPEQIVRWTPYDWSPLSYLTVGAWRGLVGMHPIVLRYLTVLIFMPGCAFTYAAMRRMRGERAALAAMLAYAALSFHVYLSMVVRGSGFVIALLPLVLWLVLRYLDRPTIRRAAPLGVVMALLIYTYLTGAIALAMVGLYTLIVYREKVWRWWLPGVIAALLILPEILSKLSLSIQRTEATRSLTLPPFFEALTGLYNDYTGVLFPLWIILVVGAGVLIVVRQRPPKASTVALLVWFGGGPVLLYALNPVLGFFLLRYAWWVVLGIALWVGVGLSYLPRPALIGVSALLLAAMFAPLPMERYDLLPNPPMADNFEWLQQHARWGDAVVVDPNNRECGDPFEWDYYTRLFFPDGLTFATDPAGYRRVWYVTHDSWQVPALERAILDGRLPGIFSGPPECLFRLYEGPPDAEGILYENGLRFHGMDIIEEGGPSAGPLARREGEPLRVRLWWSADRHVEFDYSTSLLLYTETMDATLIQLDGPPQTLDAPDETSRWETGRLYVDERELVLPPQMTTGGYPLLLVVYQWWDNARIAAPGVDAENRLLLETVSVKAW